MTARSREPSHIERIRQAYPSYRNEHRKRFSSMLELIKKAQDVHLLSVKVARRAIDEGVDVDFLNAYVALLTRTVTNIESILQLVEIANYGSCFALLRTLMTDYDTLRYLATKPELPAEWFELVKYYKPGVARSQKNSRWKELEAKFADIEIRRQLDALGEDTSPAGYGMMSEASHSTAWGVMFYSKPDYARHMHFDLSPFPKVDIRWSVQILGMLVSFLLQLIPCLLDRAPVVKAGIPGMDHLAAAARIIASVRTDYLANRIYKEIDVIDKVWKGEISIPNDPKDWPESFKQVFEE